MKTVSQASSETRSTIGLKRIVVGINGSELSRETFAYGAMIAKAADIEIQAMHVWEAASGGVQDLSWEPSIIQRRLSQLEVSLPEGHRGDLASAYKVIEDCREYCQNYSIKFSTSLKCGPILNRFSELESDELLVVGKGRFENAGFGSTTRRLLHHAACPVMIISGPLRAISRVIAIFDGSQVSFRAIEMARMLARQTRWPLNVFVISNSDALSDALQAAQDHAPEAQVMVYGPIGGSQASQIEQAAERVKSGLVVLPAYSDSWFHQFLFGGTTGHVLSHLDAPIMLVH
jgi:nucleotide-binding universal stress UspA family protein